MCRKKLLGLQRGQIFNQGKLFRFVFLGGGGGGWRGQSDLENCAYLWKNPGYALLPTSYFKLQTSDLTKFELRISDFLPLRLNAAWLDFEPPASHFPLLTSDFRLPISNFRLPTSDFRLLCQARSVLNPDNLTGDFTWSKIAADDWKRTRLLTTWQGGHF